MKKKLSLILSVIMVMTSLVACGQKSAKEEVKPSQEPVVARVASLKGPTSMGMVKFIKDEETSKDKAYEFTIANSVDEITPKLVKGEVDIAAVPANLASVVCGNTKGGIKTLSINTLGVLYIVSKDESIKNVSDLKGKTIYTSGKGASPEYVLNYILKSNKIDPAKDLNIVYKTEHTEALAALVNDPNGIAMLPEPFVSVAKAKNKDLNIALDMTKEWDKINGGKSNLVTGVVVAKKDFIKDHPEKIGDFLKKYKASIEYTNTNIEDASKLIGDKKIVPGPIAKLAIPKCNIKYIDGQEMKTSMDKYLKVLFDANPKSVGGKLPGEDFYYIQK